MSKARQVMDMSRDTFHRYKSAVEDGGVEVLFERTRRKPNLGNRVDQTTEDAVIKSATDFPAHGQARTSKTKVAEEGAILTEARVQALEKKKLDDEACAWGRGMRSMSAP